MDADELTTYELDALAASRKAVIAEFKEPMLAWPVARFVPEDERQNPGLSLNPVGGGGRPAGTALRTITVFANGVIATMDVLGTEPVEV